MPDVNGVLTESERATIHDWFQRSWLHRACPVCGKLQWVLVDHVIIPVIYTPLGTSIGGTNYPQIMIVCQNCGLTLYFNAVTIGILEGVKPNAR